MKEKLACNIQYVQKQAHHHRVDTEFSLVMMKSWTLNEAPAFELGLKLTSDCKWDLYDSRGSKNDQFPV